MDEEQGSDQVDETEEQDVEEVEETDADEQDSDDEDGFDGEFDAKRARRTIDKLRNDLKAAKAAKPTRDSKETATVRAENMRLRVALKAGLDDDLADRLRGETEDELLADAEKLLNRFYPEKKTLDTRQPRPKFKGGSKPNEEPELSATEAVAKALGR